MAILLSNSGKTVETNKATLQRLARENGDAITFTKRPHFEDVLLNHRPVGRLFESHEKTIAYLASIARTAGAPHSGRAARGIRRLNRTARKNPADRPPIGGRGPDLTPLFTKPIGPQLRKQILAEIRASKLPTLADKLSAAAKKHGVAGIRVYTIAKKAGLTTKRK